MDFELRCILAALSFFFGSVQLVDKPDKPPQPPQAQEESVQQPAPPVPTVPPHTPYLPMDDPDLLDDRNHDLDEP